ncbi:hypothetical protein ACFWFF_36335 [Streptomyces sp. NPDC060223]|uniref:MmyB family transcriptional regulator n=1 Tax=Streptomyces sp. NPDC060223 TaxID=3347077 RepID=UPI00365643A7
MAATGFRDPAAVAAQCDVAVCLLHPGISGFYVDRERVVREGIAHLRAAWAAYAEDQALAELIAGNE